MFVLHSLLRLCFIFRFQLFLLQTLYIIAGPNGAGKTTAANSLLPDIFRTVEFVNADEIAKGLSPFNPDGVALQAGKIMLQRIEQLISENKSFAFETTLSGLTYIRYIQLAKAKGYEIILFFVWLNSFDLAKERVAIRVSKGGHNIPNDVVERCYKRGIENFSVYAVLCDEWYILNNSSSTYKYIAKFTRGEKEILNFELYNKITSL